MRKPLLRGTGRHVAAIVSNNLTVPLPPSNPGDVLLVFIEGNSFDVADAHPPVPAGWEFQTGDDSGQFFYGLYTLRVTGIPPTSVVFEPHPDITSKITMWSGIGLSVTRVTTDLVWFDNAEQLGTVVGGPTDQIVMTPAGVFDDGRLLVSGIMEQPAILDGPPSVLTVVEGDAVAEPPLDVPLTQFVARYTPVSIEPNQLFVILDASDPYFTRVFFGFSISIIGIADITFPSSPQPDQLALDCATDYTPWLTYGDYRTRLDTVGWTDLKWGRILDETSTAEVTIPDITGGVRCCIPHAGMRPWAFGLLIERNHVEVWSGAVVTVRRDRRNGTTTLGCSDVTARYEKRFAVRDTIVDWRGTDAGVAFSELINQHAASSSDVWYTPAPLVFTGSAITRRLLPRRFEMAAAIIGELADSAIDYFVMNGVIYIWEPGVGWVYADGFLPPAGDTVRTYDKLLQGPYNNQLDLVYGLFTNEAFAEPPDWGMNGMMQTNFVAVPSPDSGEFGFRNVFFADNAESQSDVGVLDHVEPNSLDLPEDAPPAVVNSALAQRAVSYIDLHAFPPLTLEGGTLKEGAPVDIPNLIPGSIWAIDIEDACYGRTLGVARLKSVSVSAQIRDGAIIETVSPTLYPPGFRGPDE